MRLMQIARLLDLAETIRSKNAGVERVTFDVIFSEQLTDGRVRSSPRSRAPRFSGNFASTPIASPIM